MKNSGLIRGGAQPRAKNRMEEINNLNRKIPVIDLFAGPGGLGEGFSSFRNEAGTNPFEIALSVEKDPNAFNTLETRSLFRYLNQTGDVSDYFEYVRGSLSRDDLFSRHRKEANFASKVCRRVELGGPTVSSADLKERILSSIGDRREWILIGGPPCQAYSIIGRSRVRKIEPEKYEKDSRHFLYREYLKIVADYSPPLFLMENVKGLLSTRINGINMFAQIVKDLESPRETIGGQIAFKSALHYRIYSLSTSKPPGSLTAKEYVVKAERYGIPQKRHRVFLFGIRADLPEIFPSMISLRQSRISYSVQDAIGDLQKLRGGLSDTHVDSWENWREMMRDIYKAKWFNSDQIDRSVRSEMQKNLALILKSRYGRGSEFIETSTAPDSLREYYQDKRLAGICNHSTRSHIPEDQYRYFFASCFSKVYGYSPTLHDYPRSLLPNHKNVAYGRESIIFSDRFRVQIRNEPSSTITSHISKDGHYYIHYDPKQCRSLTVREAARLQTFPDNYFFEGPRTEQYRQVGNAVPPILARRIAAKIYKLLEIIR